MSGISRRKAMALGVSAPATGMAFPLGGEIDSAMVGVLIRIAWQHRRWEVWVPDWENKGDYWTPGMMVPGKWIALTEYLGELEREFELVPQA